MLNNGFEFFATFLIAVALTSLFSELLRRIAIKLKLVAEPNERKIHSDPTPNLGGLAIFLGYFPAILYFDPSQITIIFMVTSFFVVLLGFLDDLIEMNPVLKLVILAIIVTSVSYFGFAASMPFLPIFGDYAGMLNILTTLLWTILVISSINAIDNMDGLAPGVGMIACIMFFLIGYFQFPHYRWALYSIGMVGSLQGFLFFNFHPAKIFMGDSGSFFLGYFLAIMSVKGKWSAHPLKSIIIPVVILSVPILDLIFIVIYRYLRGITDGPIESIKYSAKDHLSHRIQQVRNFGQVRTVLIIYGISLVVGLLGVIMRNTHPFEAGVALSIVVTIYSIIVLLILPNLNDITWRWSEGTYESN